MTIRAAPALVLGLAVLTVALAVPQRAAACSGVSMAELGAVAPAPDMVFTGTVVKRDEPFTLGTVIGSDDPIGWTFVVESVEKGPQADRVRVESPRMDASCGVEFSLGGRYRIQAHDEGGALSVNQGDVEQLERLAGDVRPPTEAGGLTFGAWPAVIGLAGVLLVLAFVAWSALGAPMRKPRPGP